MKEIDGATFEPVEELVIEVEPQYQGAVIQQLGIRRATIREMKQTSVGTVRMECLIASRALIGYRSEFLTPRAARVRCITIFMNIRNSKGKFQAVLPEF
jgi:Predicted membrane GTPase involved in stress response